MWHEIVNDTVGGRAVVATYCPLCNSGLVFERRVADSLLDFGTSGMLYKSDLVMYDRQSHSLWAPDGRPRHRGRPPPGPGSSRYRRTRLHSETGRSRTPAARCSRARRATRGTTASTPTGDTISRPRVRSSSTGGSLCHEDHCRRDDSTV